MPFVFEPAPLPGVIIVRSKRLSDARGHFWESYKQSDFAANGIKVNFVQDNLSFSRQGVIRGLHFQRRPKAQGKLVRVISGRAWDVAVDLRRGSPSYLEHFAIELSADEQTMLYIPPGFGHGFAALTDVYLSYQCTNEYAPELDAGVAYDDPDIGILWPITQPLLSPKDQGLPPVAAAELFD